MACGRYDQHRAIVLLVRARKTGTFYTNLENTGNEEIFKTENMVTHISGKVQVGELDISAMIREGREESGVDFSGKIIIPETQTLDFSDYHGWPVVWGYAEVENEFEGKPTDKSVRFNRWMTRSEIMVLCFKEREIRLETQPALEAYLAVRGDCI